MDECPHFIPLLGAEKVAIGANPAKRWGLCLHEDRPLGGKGVVCPCQGCGPGCRGYPGHVPVAPVPRAVTGRVIINGVLHVPVRS